MGRCAAALISLALLAGAGWAGAAFAAPPETQASALPYKIQWGVKIAMRDGVQLDATVIRPVGDATTPVILTLTPYVADRFEDVGAYFARHGYAFVIVDDRGRGNSEGRFSLWTKDGQDGHDLVEWLAAQPWSDGQVAMWGGSYGGKNQWMIAGEQPKGLKAIAPASAGIAGENIGMTQGDIFRGLDYNWLVSMMGHTANNNGAGDEAYWLGVYREASKGLVPYRALDTLAGYPSAIWREWMAHPVKDAYWDAASTAPDRWAHIQIPSLSITGAYDTSETGTIAFRQRQLDATPPAVGSESYLVIGPWDHPGSRNPKRKLGGIDFGDAAVLDVKALHLAWYDHVLKGAPTPSFLRDRVVYFVAGSNVWRSAPTLGAATARRDTLWLSSPNTTAESIAAHGSLSPEAMSQPADSYVYDPSLPAHNEGFEGGAMVSPTFLTSDALMRRIKGDGLIYDSAPLATATDLVGVATLTLDLALDVPDTDIRAALYEVKADGSVVFLTQDWVRARYRLSDRQPVLATPGRVAAYRFEHFNFVARTLAQGSVVRLVVVPLGASLQVERNRNSAKPVELQTAADNRVARVELHMGPGLSHLELPWGR
jgi:putative CocE/NonD family hydrolase